MIKRIDKFLLHDLCKSFQKCSVAYYIDDIQPYNKALASVRMQCYDMINWFEKEGIKAELYKPFKQYEIVFFIKTRSNKAVKKAEKLRRKGIHSIMYAYYEFIDDESRIDDWERKNILKLTANMDIINVVGKIQYEKFSKYHEHVNIIGDSVNEDFFKIQKQHTNKKTVTLIYCGYYSKVKDTLCIKETIQKLQEKYGCQLVFLTDKDPEIEVFKYTFIKYDQKKIPVLFTLGDIMIAPRPMEDIEKLSHSNTKIAYPMAVGLPVVASPVPSYLDSPAIICKSEEEWYIELEKLILDSDMRKELGEKSSEFIKNNYSLNHIGQIYKKMIQL